MATVTGLELLHLLGAEADRMAGIADRIGDALSHYRQAQAIFHEIGDRLTEATVLMELGQAQRDLGEADAARQCWQTALSMFEDLGDTRAEQVRSKLRDLSVQEIPQD